MVRVHKGSARQQRDQNTLNLYSISPEKPAKELSLVRYVSYANRLYLESRLASSQSPESCKLHLVIPKEIIKSTHEEFIHNTIHNISDRQNNFKIQ